MAAMFGLCAEGINSRVLPFISARYFRHGLLDSMRGVDTIHCKEQTLVGRYHGARRLLEQFDRITV